VNVFLLESGQLCLEHIFLAVVLYISLEVCCGHVAPEVLLEVFHISERIKECTLMSAFIRCKFKHN